MDAERKLRASGARSAPKILLRPPRNLCGLCAKNFLSAAGGVAFAAFDAFADAGGFAAPSAEVIELCAAHLALAHHLHRIHERAIHREHALDALAIGKLAHGEALVQPFASAGDAD